MIRTATPADLNAVGALLRAAGLPADGLAGSAMTAHVAVGEGGDVIGAAAIERAGDAALLRSVVVEPAHRGRGLGRALVARAEREALRGGVRRLALLTEGAAAWFESLGYARIARAEAPAALRATAQFTSLCPDSAACLAKPLAVTIYHNPACGTSRNVLGLLRESGIEPRVIEYLKTPPDRATLETLLSRMGITARELLRQKGTPSEELGLADPSVTHAEILDRMLEHPILINRPIVVAPWAVKLCRPSETVRELLEG